MDFSSDTSAPAHPRIVEALARANTGQAASYGADEWTEALERELRQVFEVDLAIWPLSSGTAANALSAALLCSAAGAILCHEEAHIERDERGAPEFFTGGGKLRLLPGEGAKIDLAALDAVCAAHRPAFFHATPAEALSLTNLTECGTAYTPAEIAERTARVRELGLGVHLDGARFANALVSGDASPADLTWRAGVDVLSLGFTKLGALGCDLVVLFDPGAVRGPSAKHLAPTLAARFEELRVRAKRAGHVPAKLRYVAAQGVEMLRDDLWIELARTANSRARALAAALLDVSGVTLRHPADGNEVLAVLPDAVRDRLVAAGAKFYPWSGGSHRFVCSWTTRETEIEDVRRALEA